MKIAIIGAGFSGLTAAYLLEKKGHDVTVYEKETEIGGHCKTLRNGGIQIELGTVFAFPDHIKPLLIELKINYSERFTHRNFISSDYRKVEHVSREHVPRLMEEIKLLDTLLKSYCDKSKSFFYDEIPKALMVPVDTFLAQHGLTVIGDVISPLFSSFGFGDIQKVKAYYAFRIFDCDTIQSFIRNDKFLFADLGVGEIIKRLSDSVSDIRYGMPAVGIHRIGNSGVVETYYDKAEYDRVFITSKLPDGVVKDAPVNLAMQKIETNPYVTCVYEVEGHNMATTYFKANLGSLGKIQFYHTFKHENQMILVGYAYGHLSTELVKAMENDLLQSGLKLKRLISTRQWHIFPHLPLENSQSDFYHQLIKNQALGPIQFLGSLISKPSLSHLYASIKTFLTEGNY